MVIAFIFHQTLYRGVVQGRWGPGAVNLCNNNDWTQRSGPKAEKLGK